MGKPKHEHDEHVVVMAGCPGCEWEREHRHEQCEAEAARLRQQVVELEHVKCPQCGEEASALFSLVALSCDNCGWSAKSQKKQLADSQERVATVSTLHNLAVEAAERHKARVKALEALLWIARRAGWYLPVAYQDDACALLEGGKPVDGQAGGEKERGLGNE